MTQQMSLLLISFRLPGVTQKTDKLLVGEQLHYRRETLSTDETLVDEDLSYLFEIT
jgi:hypothetical protein